MVDLDAYYGQQAGTGVAMYPSMPHQRGRGFFGRFFKGSLLPLLQSLGHKILSTGVDVADDVVNNNIDPMTALKTRGRIAAKEAANSAISTARSRLGAMKQSGTGKRRRKSIKGCAKPKSVITKSAVTKSTSRAKKSITKNKTKTQTKTKRKTKSKRASNKLRKVSKVPKFLEF